MSRTRLLTGLLLAVAAGCVDPHARPVPPRVLIQLPDSLVVHSPGTIPHTVYAFDPNGLERIRVRVRTDSLVLIDSSRAPSGLDFTETTQSFIWSVPAGLPAGTAIHLVAIATDFIGLVSSDSTVILIQ